jgi:hypothetical protein
MRNQRGLRWVVGALAAAAFVLALSAVTARAQQTAPPGAPLPGNRDPLAEARERQQREAQLRSNERLGVPRSKEGWDVAAVIERMKDDFRGLQVQRNKLVRRLQSGGPLDYKHIAEEAESINKRAGRLRQHLLREAAGAEKKEPEKPLELGDGQLNDALFTMCKRIDSFTENPIFKVPSVVDVEQSAKADRDLRHILVLSGGIKRAAERLDKTHKK